jgi:hypothetical protein
VHVSDRELTGDFYVFLTFHSFSVIFKIHRGIMLCFHYDQVEYSESSLQMDRSLDQWELHRTLSSSSFVTLKFWTFPKNSEFHLVNNDYWGFSAVIMFSVSLEGWVDLGMRGRRARPPGIQAVEPLHDYARMTRSLLPGPELHEPHLHVYSH